MAKKIRVGLVGVGGMGGCHFYNYEKIENAELVAVCDKWEKGLEKAKSEVAH